jgi:hypothetical protein
MTMSMRKYKREFFICSPDKSRNGVSHSFQSFICDLIKYKKKVALNANKWKQSEKRKTLK